METHSELGKGSVFRITVPLSRASAGAQPREAPAYGSFAGRLVVIVDDDLRILEAMRLLIAGWGAEVLVARGADDALEALERRARTPDVILADYSLEAGATGFEAIETIRGACGARVPAFIVTGETDPAVLDAIRASGCAHLIKPTPPARLRAALSYALRSPEADSSG